MEDGEQTAVFFLDDIKAEARTRAVLRTGDQVLRAARETIAELDAALGTTDDDTAP